MFLKATQKVKFSDGYLIGFPTYTIPGEFCLVFAENWNSADFIQLSAFKTHKCIYIEFFKCRFIFIYKESYLAYKN